MIVKSRLRTDPRNQEILPEPYEALSYVGMKTVLGEYPDGYFPWHWHDAFEIDYLVNGQVQVHTPEQTECFSQGDVVFINSGIPHEYQAVDDSPCEIIAFLFDMHFLSGMYNSPLERKYILPIRESSRQIHRVSPNTVDRLRMVEHVLRCVELENEEPFGYEFELRSHLCRFWVGLFQETAGLRTESRANSMDTLRIKKMLTYVHEHCNEKLTASDIAAVAGISVRECSRCFDRCIGVSPIQYLNSYRLHMAAEMLLSTKASILEISENCGFNSAAYFSKLFSDAMGCTPHQYRTGAGQPSK